MKKKLIGIFVCMLLITTVLPISGLAEYNEKKAVNTKINDSLEIKPVGYQGNGEILDQSQTLQYLAGLGIYNQLNGLHKASNLPQPN